ncbi:hypothetical protein N836_03530 [Leptolyngbya sp. Heron Island J]|uniref:hypothetical protein n=1 Tax=Leptolyngbya sp. Heron Island J TaxID=1385935 RepID=UPI0003B9E7AE|nr:hypothetical protein [Leptolyngbya sp. Heron Island J]ESA37319.1 hypothetical protein N836_03530 [Leptolyngbya sp. Heron Island J]
MLIAVVGKGAIATLLVAADEGLGVLRIATVLPVEAEARVGLDKADGAIVPGNRVLAVRRLRDFKPFDRALG